MNEEPILRRDIKPMLALIIVNWDYIGSQFEELLYPEQDGEVLERKLLRLLVIHLSRLCRTLVILRAVLGGTRQSISCRRWNGSISITQVTLLHFIQLIKQEYICQAMEGLMPR